MTKLVVFGQLYVGPSRHSLPHTAFCIYERVSGLTWNCYGVSIEVLYTSDILLG